MNIWFDECKRWTITLSVQNVWLICNYWYIFIFSSNFDPLGFSFSNRFSFRLYFFFLNCVTFFIHLDPFLCVISQPHPRDRNSQTFWCNFSFLLFSLSTLKQLFVCSLEEVFFFFYKLFALNYVFFCICDLQYFWFME